MCPGCVKTPIVKIIFAKLAPRLQVINPKRFSFSLGNIDPENLYWLNNRGFGIFNVFYEDKAMSPMPPLRQSIYPAQVSTSFASGYTPGHAGSFLCGHF